MTYVSVTEQWAQMAVAGPKSRATLQKIVDGVTLDDTTFPYLAAREIGSLGGIPARLFRISFSGEHAYELAVPADYGSMIAPAVMKAGEEFGIAPYGVEALSIMRIEKGHVAGDELNGTTTAADLGLGRMMSSKKDYIGRMMASREGLTEKHRQCIVGIRAVNKSDRIRAGSHLLRKNDPPSMANDQGYISSVAWSPMSEQWVGLALLANGRERHGEMVKIFDGLRDNQMPAKFAIPCITIGKIKNSMPEPDMIPSGETTARFAVGEGGSTRPLWRGQGLPDVELSVRHPASIVTVIARKGCSERVADAIKDMKSCDVDGPDSISITSSPTDGARALFMAN